jgi:hypothetical protein
MYSLSQLTQEIRALIDARIQSKHAIHPDWITQEILNNHADVDGEDSDFYLCVGKESVRAQVRQQINRFKLTPDKALNVDRQLVLPGYERLQSFYLIGADGEQIAMPLERMSAAQRQAKILELRAMGDGCHQHADELERYAAEHPALDEQQAA